MAKAHCNFEGMCWNTAGEYAIDLEWRLRYSPASITKNELMIFAGYLECYRELINCTQKKRNHVARQIAMLSAPNEPPNEAEPKL